MNSRDINFRLQKDPKDNLMHRTIEAAWNKRIPSSDAANFYSVKDTSHFTSASLKGSIVHGIKETVIHEGAHGVDKLVGGLGTKYLLPKVVISLATVSMYKDVQNAAERKQNLPCVLVNTVTKNSVIVAGNIGVNLLTSASAVPSGGTSLMFKTLGYIAVDAAAPYVGNAAQKVCEKITTPPKIELPRSTTLTSPSIRKLF